MGILARIALMVLVYGFCAAPFTPYAFSSSPAEIRHLVYLFKNDREEFHRQAFVYLENKGYSLPESLELLRLFSCGMFSKACDPHFTEDLCRKLESLHGLSDSDFLFLRAANLEALTPKIAPGFHGLRPWVNGALLKREFGKAKFASSPAKRDWPVFCHRQNTVYGGTTGSARGESMQSYELYTRILDNDNYSPLKEELVRKLYLLSCYLDRREAFLQWCRQKHIRPALYIGERETPSEESPKKVMRLTHTPYRTFIGKAVLFKAPFQGPRTTPFVEDTYFQWYLTSTAIHSQLPFLENAFYREGFREVSMDTAYLKKAHVCFLDMVPVYYLSVFPRDGTRFPVHSRVDFKVIMVPYFPASLYTVRWYIGGDEQKVLTGAQSQMYFERRGSFQLTVIVRFGLYTMQKQLRFYVE